MIHPAPGTLRRSPWLVGKDKDGHWVVRDQAGLHGGIFVDRAAALHFALLENGHGPQAAVMVPGILELDMAPREGRSAASKSQEEIW
jgi:hypothetical protein